MSSSNHRPPTVEDDPDDVGSPHRSSSSPSTTAVAPSLGSESTVRPPPHPAADDASVDSGYSSRTNKSSADSETLDQKLPPAAPSPPRSSSSTAAAAPQPTARSTTSSSGRRNTSRKPQQPPHPVTIVGGANTQRPQASPQIHHHPQQPPLKRSNSSAARMMPCGNPTCREPNCRVYGVGPSPVAASRPPPAMWNSRAPAQHGYVAGPPPGYYNPGMPTAAQSQPMNPPTWSQTQQPISRPRRQSVQGQRPSSFYGGMSLGPPQQYTSAPNPQPPPIQTAGISNRSANYNYTPTTPSPYATQPPPRPPLPHPVSEPAVASRRSSAYAPQYADQLYAQEPAPREFTAARPSRGRRSTSPAVVQNATDRYLMPPRRRPSVSRGGTRPTSYHEYLQYPDDEITDEYDVVYRYVQDDEDEAYDDGEEPYFVQGATRRPRETRIYHLPPAASTDLAHRYTGSHSVPRTLTVEGRERQQSYRRPPLAQRRWQGQMEAAQQHISQNEHVAGGRPHDVSELARPDPRHNQRHSQASGMSEDRAPRTASHYRSRRASAHSRPESHMSTESRDQSWTISNGESTFHISGGDGTEDIKLRDGQIIINTEKGREKRYISSGQSRMSKTSASSKGSRNARASHLDSRITSKTASVGSRLDEES